MIVALTAWLLWHTSFGLRLRSCGESPAAAESLGVNVYRYKYIAVLVSGALAGLGGAFLALVASSGFVTNQTGGRGYIGLAAMIFGNWMPLGTVGASLMFGYTDALRLRTPVGRARAAAAGRDRACSPTPPTASTRGPDLGDRDRRCSASASWLWFLLTDTVPREFTGMTPYVATLLVLSLATQRLRMPAADGQVYRKGSGRMTARTPQRLRSTGSPARRGGRGDAATPTRRTPHYPVGAAGRVDDGRVVSGCNVENAAYGVALCAECGMVSELHLTGGGRLTHFVCVDGDGAVIMPCGRCRQLLFENGGPDLELMTGSGVKRMDEVLPGCVRSRQPRLTWPTPQFVADPYPFFAEERRRAPGRLARAVGHLPDLRPPERVERCSATGDLGRLWRDREPAAVPRAVQPAPPQPDDGERAARAHPAPAAGGGGVQPRAHRAAPAPGASPGRRAARRASTRPGSTRSRTTPSRCRCW